MSDATTKSARLTAILELAKMRFRLFYREPGTMYWTFGFPIVMSIVLGVAFRNRGPETVYLAVEQGPQAEVAAQMLAKGDGVDVRVMGAEDASQALRTGRVSLVVVPQEDTYQYRFDPTRPESKTAKNVADDALQRGKGRGDVFTHTEKTVTDPGSRYIDFLIPGLVGLGLMSTGLWGIGFALAEMRTKKLLKRLIATPMRRSDFLFSFLVVKALLLVVEVPPILIFAKLVFDVGVQGSLVSLAIITLIGSLSFSVIGLFLASRAENPQIVSGLINVFSFPMYLCSGVFFQSTRFPDALQPIIRWMPLTALNDAIRGVMIDGKSLFAVADRVGVVALWGVVAFALALKFFRWR